jgi:hypothetical protein
VGTVALMVELSVLLLKERFFPSPTVVPSRAVGAAQGLAPEQSELVESLARACRVVFRWCWRGASCLERTQAVAEILRRRGIPAEIRCGVSRCDDKVFSAHAWLAVGGTVLVGPALTEEVTFRPVGECAKLLQREGELGR